MNCDDYSSKDSICEERNYNIAFRKHSKEVFNYLVYHYGDKQLAEDIIQEAFLTLWQNCKNVPLKNVRAYLYTISRNKIIDSFRSIGHAQNYKKNIINTTEKQTPEYIFEEKEFHQKLNGVLDSMPEKYRVPFLLNRIDKKKYKEIAEIMDVSVKSVEKRIFNALEFLQNELQINKKRF
ncbi:RNA polymerase sigma factor [Flavivirga rizhaonensis]|uniref:Sigma-70 family RNA polymerase sigma factor n=1 Tax=Flavivirga rizhaonensis TaxID=2559571 RepID=A0A4S1DSU8_9FLAO|nr:sigma-70 family RNA polymerase sigma factor [Flavivirga rizhaonensis]TGV01100.1 sigma-70 family RNA polymerase sigma factor [Flavivirga rizhaonensis]